MQARARPTTIGKGQSRDAPEGKGPRRRPQWRLGRRLEGVAKAVGGSYCRLQMLLKLALGVRETVAGHRLGALEEGGYLPPRLTGALPTPPLCQHSPRGVGTGGGTRAHAPRAAVRALHAVGGGAMPHTTCFRVDSSNFNPVPFWGSGTQFVAFNAQTDDRFARVHHSFFASNGRYRCTPPPQSGSACARACVGRSARGRGLDRAPRDAGTGPSVRETGAPVLTWSMGTGHHMPSAMRCQCPVPQERPWGFGHAIRADSYTCNGGFFMVLSAFAPQMLDLVMWTASDSP